MSSAFVHNERYGEHEHALAATTKEPGSSWRARVSGSRSWWMIAAEALPRGSQAGGMSAGVLVPFRGIERDGR
jgi:hypothetical protein